MIKRPRLRQKVQILGYSNTDTNSDFEEANKNIHCKTNEFFNIKSNTIRLYAQTFQLGVIIIMLPNYQLSCIITPYQEIKTDITVIISACRPSKRQLVKMQFIQERIKAQMLLNDVHGKNISTIELR